LCLAEHFGEWKLEDKEFTSVETEVGNSMPPLPEARSAMNRGNILTIMKEYIPSIPKRLSRKFAKYSFQNPDVLRLVGVA